MRTKQLKFTGGNETFTVFHFDKQILIFHMPQPNLSTNNLLRQDSTDGRAVALYPADPGSNPVVSMLQRALWLSVSADRPN